MCAPLVWWAEYDILSTVWLCVMSWEVWCVFEPVSSVFIQECTPLTTLTAVQLPCLSLCVCVWVGGCTMYNDFVYACLSCAVLDHPTMCAPTEGVACSAHMHSHNVCHTGVICIMNSAMFYTWHNPESHTLSLHTILVPNTIHSPSTLSLSPSLPPSSISPPFLSPSLPLSMYISLSLSLCISPSLPLSLPPSLPPSLSLCISPSFPLSPSLSLCISPSLSLSMYISLPLSLPSARESSNWRAAHHRHTL